MEILGIELGSTRIKSVLVDECGKVLASGAHEWENRLENGFWTYALTDVWAGVRQSYSDLNRDYTLKFGKPVTMVAAIGISAMMHGYLAFDGNRELLTPFRTWRNTTTGQAAAELTEKLGFNIPQRWSVSHYYQAVLNGEKHVHKVDFLTTLAGYVHWKLTGRMVLGIGDASGMFPISGNNYDKAMLHKFQGILGGRGIGRNFEELLPEVLCAGETAGVLTESGAKLLDPAGNLQAGAMLCPPEGDAGTGMAATNSVKERTGNVSAGTSAFVMVVLEKPLSSVHPELDVVTTPSGKPVAMVHVNHFTSEINAWSNLFHEVIELGGGTISKGELMTELFRKSLESDEQVGKLTGYNFLSGEPVAGMADGRPLFSRQPDGCLNLANFMQMQIYSALGSLGMGMEILRREGVAVDGVCGHGGFFKTEFVGANAMAAAVNAPVTVMRNAGEGGAWGIALLALFAVCGKGSLEEFLSKLFDGCEKAVTPVSQAERAKFLAFLQRYQKGLRVEALAAEVL